MEGPADSPMSFCKLCFSLYIMQLRFSREQARNPKYCFHAAF